jgi:uncharacterized membrane protein HdeD (DUF308 family)
MAQQISQADIDSALAAARAAIRENWGWFLGLGIVFVLAGFGAIGFPLLTTIAAKVALGWIFMIGGGVTVAHAFSAMGWRGFLLNFLIGALYLVAGAWLAFLPFTGIITLTILLAALFLAEGVLEMIMAIRVRPHEGWSWLLLSGLIAIAAGLMWSRTAGISNLGHRPAGRCQPSLDRHQLHHAGPGGTRCRCACCDGLVMSVSERRRSARAANFG